MTNPRTLHVRRTTGWLAAGAILLVTALSGCLRVDMDLSVSDETISGSLLTALDRDFTQLIGMQPEDVFPLSENSLAHLEGVDVSPYAEGNFAGVVYEFDRVTLAGWDELADADEQLPRFVYDAQDGTYEFTMTVDLTDWFDGDDELDLPGTDAQELRDSFEYQVSITFPGEVLEHNGGVSGTTVTWQPALGERSELRAVALEHGAGPASKNGSGSTIGVGFLVVIGVMALLAIAVGGVIVWLVLRRRTA